MDQGTATVLSATLAALAALMGYAITQALGRRERRAERFAQAIRAVYEYQDTAYQILRRSSHDALTRERLGAQHGKVADGIRYHFALMRTESPLVHEAYEILFHRTRWVGSLFRSWAWLQPLIVDDAAMAIDPPFRYDTDEEFDLCIDCMTLELAWFRNPMRKRELQKRIKELRVKQQQQPGPGTFADVEQRLVESAQRMTRRRGL